MVSRNGETVMAEIILHSATTLRTVSTRGHPPVRSTYARTFLHRIRFAIVPRRSFAQERGRRPALSADSFPYLCVRNARLREPPTPPLRWRKHEKPFLRKSQARQQVPNYWATR